MIDQLKLDQLKGEIVLGTRSEPLSHLSLDELIKLRDEIDDLLPDTRKMDLHKELATQYALVKQFQQSVLVDDEVPANQVAQCLNTTVATLGHLIKLQESLERVETFKRMEACLIEALALLSDEAKAKFFEEYAALGHERGLA